MNVYGLDLSTACTGIALPDGSTDHHRPRSSSSLVERAVSMRNWLRDYLLPGVDLVVIEAYGTRFIQTAYAMGHVHCLVDEMLAANDVPSVKVPPTRLKQYATGRGRVPKYEMEATATLNGWRPSDDSTDDEADAWWLRAIGRHLLGEPVVPLTGPRLDVIDIIRTDNDWEDAA